MRQADICSPALTLNVKWRRCVNKKLFLRLLKKFRSLSKTERPDLTEKLLTDFQKRRRRGRTIRFSSPGENPLQFLLLNAHAAQSRLTVKLEFGPVTPEIRLIEFWNFNPLWDSWFGRVKDQLAKHYRSSEVLES